MNQNIKVGIVHGDINGDSYKMILQTFSDERMLEFMTPVIYGSTKALSYYKKVNNLKSINYNLIHKSEQAVKGHINFINLDLDDLKIEIGKITKESLSISSSALKKAIEDVRSGKIDAIVSAPDPAFMSYFINSSEKEGEESESFKVKDVFHKTILPLFISENINMAFVSEEFRVSRIESSINSEILSKKLNLLNNSLKRDLDFNNPRIAVLSLNDNFMPATSPSDHETTESNVIRPVIEKSIEDDVLCAGPFSAKSLFSSDRYIDFDGILAMYYDQAIIPYHLLNNGEGYLSISGLPFVITLAVNEKQNFSEKEDGAYADINPLRKAIYGAIDIYNNRKNYDNPFKNPLKKMYFERNDDSYKLDLNEDAGYL